MIGKSGISVAGIDSASPPEGISVWNLGAETRNALVTTAIGANYFEDFKRYSLPYWQVYAEAHGLAIIVIHETDTFRGADGGLNGAWLKLLAPEAIRSVFPWIERISLIDTDVIVNPGAPNVFDVCPADQIGVVSMHSNLPVDLLRTRKRIAFLRKRFYSHDYPLDSSLFQSPEQAFELEGLPIHDDYFCSGFMVLAQAMAPTFSNWFEEAVQRTTEALAWEQTFTNHKVLSRGCFWLPYEYQAIWNLEMASRHPSLYQAGDLSGTNEAAMAVADTLANNYFLHFAGSWGESLAWKTDPAQVIKYMGGLDTKAFSEYEVVKPRGLPTGKKFQTKAP